MQNEPCVKYLVYRQSRLFEILGVFARLRNNILQKRPKLSWKKKIPYRAQVLRFSKPAIVHQGLSD